MKCLKCGRENEPNAMFCGDCGAFLTGEDVQNAPERHPKDGDIFGDFDKKISEPKEKPQKSKKKTILLISLISVAVLLIAGLVLLFVNCGNRSSNGGGKEFYLPDTDKGDFVLDISENDLELNTSENTVYFYAEDMGDVQKVELFDDKDKVVAQMLDDGQNGDDFEGDGVYTAAVRVDTSKENCYWFYAKTNEGKESNKSIINIIAPFTQEEIADMTQVDDGLADVYNEASYDSKTTEEKSALFVEKLEKQAKNGLVIKDTILDNGDGTITFQYESGVLGMVMTDGYNGNYAGGSNRKNSSDVPENRIATALPPNNQNNNGGNSSNAASNTTADDGDAMFLYAWGDYNDRSDPDRQAWENEYKVIGYVMSDFEEYTNMNQVLNENVTIEDMKNLKGYEYIYIGAHGNYKNFNTEKFLCFEWDKEEKYVTSGVGLLEECTEEKDIKYFSDLKSWRVVKVLAGPIRRNYAFTPAFFDEHYGRSDFKDTIFYWGSCELMGKDGNVSEEWSEVLLSKSAKAMIGFHNSVLLYYSRFFHSEFTTALMEGKTVGEAFEYAVAQEGADDGKIRKREGTDGPVAYPILRGDPDARLFKFNGQVRGKIADAVTKAPIHKILISAHNLNTGRREIFSVKRDADGNFSISLTPAKYMLEFHGMNYKTCYVNDVEVEPGVVTYLQNTVLLTERGENVVGKAGGTVTNAVNGEPVEGAQLKFRKNWGMKSGEYIKDSSGNEITIITGADGKYYTDKLPYGYYTIEAVKDGFSTAYVNIISIDDNSAAMGQDVVFVPVASGNDFRITLEWEAHPRDEDAHIVGDIPNGLHVYYNHRTEYLNDEVVASLDRDDQQGNGFETVTLTADPNGVYRYYVHHYEGINSLSTSNAIVKVYQGGVLIKQYNVPVDQGEERFWNVFNIVNGEVVTVNLILDHVVN